MSSPTRPVTRLPKSDVLSTLFALWTDIDRLVTDLPEVRWDTPVPLPAWQVRDVVAHIIGTESLLLGVPTPQVDVSGAEHVHNPIGALNEAWVQYLSGETGAELLTRFRDVTEQRRTMLTAMSEDDWNAVTDTPAGPDSYGRFMRVRAFDCWMHEQDIREALGRPSTDAELSSPVAALALDEMAASMGFVVGKKGQAPNGSRVALELTGPLVRTIRVAVDGRASVVDEFDGAPTTVIRIDGLQFTRRGGGRPLTTARPAGIEYEGDVEVGQRVVENLAYVI